MGFLVFHTSWPWIFYLLAIMNLGQLLTPILLYAGRRPDPPTYSCIYIVLGPETLYDRPERFENGDTAFPTVAGQPQQSRWYTPYLTVKRWGSAPWSGVALESVQPLSTRTPPVNWDHNLWSRAAEHEPGKVVCPPTRRVRYRLLRPPACDYRMLRLHDRIGAALPHSAGAALRRVGAKHTRVSPPPPPACHQRITLVHRGVTHRFLGPLYVSVSSSRQGLQGAFTDSAITKFNVMFGEMGAAKAAGLLAALAGGIGFMLTSLSLVRGKEWRSKVV